MKEFEPSVDFVSRVMRTVRAYEALQNEKMDFTSRLLGSRLFQCAMSGCGVLFGIFFTPAACI